MKKTLILAALFAAATFAQAQQMPPGKWWRREGVVQQLQLTSDQQNKLDDIFTAAADDLIDARAGVEKLQVALRAEIERPQLRRTEIQKIVTRLSDARGKLFEREVMMLVDMRAVLNDQQWMKMRGFLDRMQDERGGPRPNGPRPNGPNGQRRKQQ
ncbi:MAG TPA: periplasmic heavy metal sensor [Thermoanaerobaculia bacterium]|nr:periplasmic heavy metal sensor [Thermoanaerobaculia bacterium]